MNVNSVVTLVEKKTSDDISTFRQYNHILDTHRLDSKKEELVVFPTALVLNILYRVLSVGVFFYVLHTHHEPQMPCYKLHIFLSSFQVIP